MISRRDALRMAAALSAANALPLAVSPTETAALLDEPMRAGAQALSASPEGPDQPPSAARFAEALARSLYADDLPVWFSDAAPAEWSWYKQRLLAVEQATSSMFPDHGITPLSIMDEAVVALCAAVWTAGLVAGAEVEHLRQALIKPTRVCTTCNGYGVLRACTAHEASPPACEHCGGTGTVASGAL